jgi:hypothetical protein
MYRRMLPALLLTASVLAGCKPERTAAQPGSSARADAASAAPAVVTVTATDYKLAVPASIPAGVVTLRLVNHGKELHQAQLVRLADGKTMADLEAALKQAGPPPSWATFVGGPNAVVPGQESASTSELTPGSYVALCLIPGPDGVPHVMKGMAQPFQVTGSSAQAALPAAQDTIRLVDYAFELSRPLTAGHHTILVVNGGPQTHELVLLRMTPGKTVKDFGGWVDAGMKGPPPAMPMGGVAALENGDQSVLSVDLPSGEYGLVCFVPDARDGKYHLLHGMGETFQVS